ncbi:hypothetical protein [Paraburkholderia hospita]|uniref:hypothetical protein n=1 Tax=Paraburkholderia hospita TaxID=169430 RepID=UPI000271DCCE|nr:hypothetical protein [Paraburkholderia hospita]EUC12647.1 hypothetical protein PMI06_008402 [Burkholderia sp. BT03]SKC46772.1 hypothetical protein SAMN06266956_0125 [Paraburkholderia hospita]
MERQLGKFRGTLPYASEMLGVYEPLIGWLSRLTKIRLEAGKGRLPTLPPVLTSTPDETKMLIQLGPHSAAVINAEGVFSMLEEGEPDLFSKGTAIQFERPEHLDCLILRELQREAARLLSAHPTDDFAFWAAHWRDTLSQPGLNKRLAVAMSHLKDQPLFSGALEAEGDPLKEYLARTTLLLGGRERAVDYVFNREAHVAWYLNSLVPEEDNPKVNEAFSKTVNGSLLKVLPKKDLSKLLEASAPTNLMFGQQKEALLSPIGILNLFRYYFYDLTTFLGPPVAHVWLGPNMTTELYEVSTRRVLEERSIEQFSEVIKRTEDATTTQDELSIAIKEANQNDTKMGTSLTGGASILVATVEASGSLNLETTESRAREETHKTTRQQSTKLSTEIRASTRTTFRTVTETTDTRSRRHVIENKESTLVNFELRRKMRQVGVQAQAIGSQLCWQVYVDDPGEALGVSQLVHLAQKTDLSQFTHRPLPTQPGTHTETITVSMPIPNPGQTSSLGPIGASGFIGLVVGAGVPGAALGVAAKVVLDSWFSHGEAKQKINVQLGTAIHQDFKVPLPEGYELAPLSQDEQTAAQNEGFLIAQNSTVPIRKSGPQGVGILFRATTRIATEGTFEITIHGGTLTSGELIEFQVRLSVRPTAAKTAAVQAEIDAITAENAAKDLAKDHALRAELVSNVRDRVKQASGIHPRPSPDLREEERTVIYRRLISRLMADVWELESDQTTAHLRSEYIKSIFDIDKMLYFVAPEWWRARRHYSFSTGLQGVPNSFATELAIKAAEQVYANFQAAVQRTAIGPLGEEDSVSWGGGGRSDNYMITDDSAAARLGSSLGWLLQLDGDTMRNAFLNAPWVHAVIPIRAGHELEALEWLKQAQVEGAAGLAETYVGPDLEALKEKYRQRHNGQDKELTIEDALILLGEDVQERARLAMTPRDIAKAPLLDGQLQTALPTEAVFESGFNPLKDGFSAVPLDDDPFAFFSQWSEVLPTDQIVAVKVAYDANGKQVPPPG